MKKRVIEVEFAGTLEKKPDTVAVMVRRTHTATPSRTEVHAVANAVKEAFGEEVLVIFLGPNEHVETLTESEMNKRGWVRGVVSDDGRTSIRRTN